MPILNRYKDTLKNLVDGLDIELPNILRPIDKEPSNIMFGFKNLPTKPKLDKNILNRLQRQ